MNRIFRHLIIPFTEMLENDPPLAVDQAGLGILLLIAALACYALWFIGIAVRSSGYRRERVAARLLVAGIDGIHFGCRRSSGG